MSVLWQNHVCLIVTGASKGFGKAVTCQFTQSFEEYHKQARTTCFGMKLILSARDEAALEALVCQLQSRFRSIRSIERIIGSMEDESTTNKLKSAFEANSGTDRVILIHNAGSLGDPSKLVNEFNAEDFASLSSYFASNVASMVTITGAFLKTFTTTKSKTIINISSLAAVSPLKGLSIYCCGKAARDAFIKSVALETDNNVRTLSYAPGPLRTAMAEELRLKSHMKEFFEDPNNILDPEESAIKLLSILKKDSFTNGSHVDYYDVA